MEYISELGRRSFHPADFGKSLNDRFAIEPSGE